MNNQFVANLQSTEDKPNSSTNSGIIVVENFKQEHDESNDKNSLSPKDIIILNDSEFNLLPPSSLEGNLVNYNLIDKIQPISIQSDSSSNVVRSTSSVSTQQKSPTTIIIHPPGPKFTPPSPLTTTITQSTPIFTLPSNPLIPISTTLTTNDQNETITTTNYEIVDTIANPVSIPDDVGPFGILNMPTFSDEQMQQLLDATAISVGDGQGGVAVGELRQNGLGGRQIHQSSNQIIPTNHQQRQQQQPFKDLTNIMAPPQQSMTSTLPNGLMPINGVQTPASSVTSSSTVGAFGMSNGILGLGDGGGDMTDYSMFIKSEAGVGGLQLEDMEVPHFIKQRYVDGKQAKIWQCGVCEKEFGHQYILMRHLPTHTDERKFQCTICGKAFRQMSTLSQHRAIHSADRPYICELCDKTFNRVSTLISHRKTHTGLKPHQCHLCNKAFHQKGNLRNHIFTHTNERPYKCDVCQKGFNQMSNLMCHKLKAHQRADKPKYICQTCGKEFQKRMGLRNHEQYEHGDNANALGNPAQRIKYTNGVLIDRINTAAMQLAIDTNEIPFALLRPLNGIPVLVRALPAGEKQLLVPATADDLKRHGHITIGGKPNSSGLNQEIKPSGSIVDIKATEIDNKENKNSKVQIRIPVVATVVQRMGKDGLMRMDVESPGPTPMENYVPNEISIGSKPLLDSSDDKENKENGIIIETTSLLKAKSNMIDDNMDVEPSTSSTRIIERSLPIMEKCSTDDGALLFNLTTSNSLPIIESADEDGKKSAEDNSRFDSGVFSGDNDQSYCEMFEILRKVDMHAVDLTGDDNPIAF